MLRHSTYHTSLFDIGNLTFFVLPIQEIRNYVFVSGKFAVPVGFGSFGAEWLHYGLALATNTVNKAAVIRILALYYCCLSLARTSRGDFCECEHLAACTISVHSLYVLEWVKPSCGMASP